MNLQIVNRSRKPVPRAFLSEWSKRMAREAAREIDKRKFMGRELVVAFVDEKEARRLNKEFRGKDYATDVLSFESFEEGVLGELVICPKVISRQARDHGVLVREELGYMLLHGFLHLLGYDHENVSAARAKRMYAIQDQIFERLRR
jgi:probable rRNA maturation factor